MSKDTIYIDVEDDITAIIGKVKGAKSKIVALVPPKRIGILQSAVNLKLLARAAKQGGKHLVLISSNTALTALASSAGIPSARNLQSKPELAQSPTAIDNTEEDVIDGVDLPIGDHARAEIGESDVSMPAPAIDSAIRANAAEVAAISPLPRPKSKERKGVGVPNFSTFRKKLVAGVAGLVLLVGFMVWAVWFAPHANIVITARTIDTSANPKVTLAPGVTTDATKGFLKATKQEINKDAVLEFEATGEKEVGEKAKGEVIFRNCESPTAATIERGTGVSAGGKTYITQATVVVPAGKGDFWTDACTPGESAPVTVVAQEIGEDYDMDTGTLCVAGHTCSGTKSLKATISTAIDGGSKRKVKVVTKEDLDKATEQFANQGIDAIKKELAGKFGQEVIVIDASFAINKDKVSSTPAVDGETESGKAKLAGSVSYTMFGVAKSEAEQFLDAYFAEQIRETENQRVYDNGVDKTTFIDVVAVENGYTATMTATATLGPKIDDATVKSEARGKKYGEIQSSIESTPGVEGVDVEFSPFWVKTVPNDEARITVEFILDESK